MPYLEKTIRDDMTALLGPGEIVLAVADIDQLTDKEIVEVVRSLAASYPRLRDYIGTGKADGLTVESALKLVDNAN